MYSKNVFILSSVISVYMVVNTNTANVLPCGHKKRELNFNNYPASSSTIDPNEYNYYQQNEINDPGYTAQEENRDYKKVSGERNTNLTSSQNLFELINPSTQMFHFIYMLPRPNNKQHTLVQKGLGGVYQQFNDHRQNVAYTGPHLFPTQLPDNNQNTQQLNMPIKNVNGAFENNYSSHLLLRSFNQNSKVPTKMEAPFMPSQFLGYGQLEKQHLPQPNQQLSHTHQKILQDYQLALQKQQQPLRAAPVHENPQDYPYQAPGLIYMAPNNIYG